MGAYTYYHNSIGVKHGTGLSNTDNKINLRTLPSALERKRDFTGNWAKHTDSESNTPAHGKHGTS